MGMAEVASLQDRALVTGCAAGYLLLPSKNRRHINSRSVRHSPPVKRRLYIFLTNLQSNRRAT